MKKNKKSEYNSYPELKNVKDQEKLKKIIEKSTKKVKVEEKTKNNNNLNKAFFYKRLLPVMITLPIAITMLTNTLRKIDDDGKFLNASSIVVEEAADNLHQAGIITVNEDGSITINKNLVKEDYQYIEITNPTVGEAYAYKKVFEKINASQEEKNNLPLIMSYGSNNQRYTDWNNFYETNKLINNEGNPSIKAFNEQSKIELIEAYNNNSINNIVKEINIIKVKTK